MNQEPINEARWRTSSFATPPDTSPAELAELVDHLRRCQHLRGKLFKAGHAAKVVNSFLAPRFVSTLVIAAVLVTAAWVAL